ncbi:hypothetical protein F4678DRAFT_411998 [Xylaria arbuscula]|nr:hypothetical protein F4678DRAFT_411998 [Xylaria arbuscula]
MSSQLHLLKSNAVLIAPTAEKPYYSIEMTSEESGCQLCIAALKPFPDPLLLLKPRPEDYVLCNHVSLTCPCASFSWDTKQFFEIWQNIHMALRYQSSDNASYAFYPDFEYEEGEALAHASLVASLALGTPVPECYESLIRKFGAPKLQEELEEEEDEGESHSSPDDDPYYDSGYSSGDSW